MDADQNWKRGGGGGVEKENLVHHQNTMNQKFPFYKKCCSDIFVSEVDHLFSIFCIFLPRVDRKVWNIAHLHQTAVRS